MKITTCDDDGGQGIGAGHTCKCVREAGHKLDSDRPHGCVCGALWATRERTPSFIGDAMVEGIMRGIESRSHALGLLTQQQRRGHSETTVTDAQWANLRRHRAREFERWQRDTARLVASGVLVFEYEANEYVVSESRPTRWVYDETEAEHEARMVALREQLGGNSGTITFPVARS